MTLSFLSDCHTSVLVNVHYALRLSQDRNGYMDENELDALLKDLCEKNKKVRI